MRYPAEETARRHQQIVAAASRLFRERGFEGVSVAELMAAAGLTHGGFYSHFGSKDDVAAAALEHGCQDMLTMADEVGAAADPRAEFIGGYLSRQHRDHPEQGCAMAALAPEVARGAAPIRHTFAAGLDALIDRVPPAPGASSQRDRRADAISTIAALVGAVVLARAVDDPTLSEEILAAVRGHFGLPPEGNDAR